MSVRRLWVLGENYFWLDLVAQQRQAMFFLFFFGEELRPLK